MKTTKPLNDRQTRVLQWIADGCPNNVMDGHSHKRSAAALRDRKLVEVSKRGGTWQAALTDEGRRYLNGEEAPITKQRSTSSAPRRAHRTGTAGTTSRPLPTADRPPTPAEELIQKVIEANGSLHLDLHNSTNRWYETNQLVQAANRTRRIPDGKRLALYHADSELDIVLEDDPFSGAEPGEVLVPPQVRTYHEAVVRYRNNTDRHEVSNSSLSRASRILHGLATECERRGYRFAWSDHGTQQYLSDFRRTLTAGQFRIVIRAHSFGLRITEKWGKTDERINMYSAKADKRPGWQGVQYRAFKPTGTLRIAITSGRDSTYADRKKTLEDQLPRLLRSLEIRTCENDREATYAEQAAQRRKAAWEGAMERGAERFAVAYRLKILEKQAAAWRHAKQMSSYLTAMKETIDQLHDSRQQQEAQQWLDWALRHVQLSDPPRQNLCIPPVPTPSPEELQPFIGRWSPHGPERTTARRY